MQIQCMPILKVIFVLSTIVAVTDCCSSRILLLRQHTLQIEEHVVQLVNQLELQQQLNVDGQPSATDMFSDAAQMLKLSPHLGFDGELASLATTERDRSIELWSTDDDEEKMTTKTLPSSTTVKSTTSTTTASSAATSTNTMATGEPPPNDDSTMLQTTTDAAISERNEETGSSTTTTETATTTTTTSASSNPKLTEDLSFKLSCSDEYSKYFCLNGGNCFRWANNANSFSYCVCAVGYVGERCDSKTENGVYVPLRPATPDPQLKTAHIVFSFPMLVLLSTIYVLFGAVFMLRNVSAQRQKQQQIHLHKQRFLVSC